jgi:hypothetical protein
MDQPCYKCGQTVEQGTTFCPHCSAPQIRVVMAEPAMAPAALADPTVTSQGAAVLPASQTVPMLALPMQWSQAVRPCALAALVASLLGSLGLHPVVAMLSAGFLAVILYRQFRLGNSVQALAGARLGALGGLFWFAMTSILQAVAVLVLHKGPELRHELITKIEQAATQTSDPQALAMFDRLRSPGGLEFLMVCALIFAFVAAIILGGIGGALGGTILGRRDKT